ncbi:hypothetical protein ACTGJ9_018355 [Bradyrhizobium sp. RDM12]
MSGHVANDLIFSEPLDVDYDDVADDDAVVIYTGTPDGTTIFSEPLDDYYDETSDLSEAEIAAGITSADYADAAPFLADSDDSRTPKERFFAMVELSYGPRWQRPLSRSQKYTQGHLGAIRAGSRALTLEVKRKVLSACLAQIRRDEERLARAKAAIIDALSR